METLFKSYPVFENNQVLTSSQLNQLTNYLDQQTRLTRVKLIGIGIVCGLELDNSTAGELKITEGTGITSHGFLINLGTCITKHYRDYTLPESGTTSVGYAPFIKGDGSQITLHELLTDTGKEKAEEDDPDEIITGLYDDPAFLDDKVVLLFLECFDRDLKSCLGKSCDELGIDRILTVRKLLVSVDDLKDYVLDADDTLGGGLFTDKFELPSTAMPRVLFDPLLDHSTKYLDFSLNYKNNLMDVFATLFEDTSVTGISGILSQSYVVFEPVLNSVSASNPFESSIVKDLQTLWKDFLNDALATGSGTTHFGIQYFYDFLKELILAYNEFKEVAFELMSECCPDTSLFPKHLMLGEAIPADACEPSIYRHGFNQATIHNNQKYLLKKATSLHKKMVLMLLNFNLDTINNPVGAANVQPPIKITPSSEKQTDLSVRSIPFYYDVNEEQTGDFEALGTLEDSWNFDIIRTCPEYGVAALEVAEVGVKDPTAIKSIAKAGMAHGADGVILSYHNNEIDDIAPLNPTQTPLLYDLDPYSFLRIEAVQGRTTETVGTKLEELKGRFDLPFNVLKLRLHDNKDLQFFKTRCNFDDLRTSYLICREEFKCYVNAICSRFVNQPIESTDFTKALENDSVSEGDNTIHELQQAFSAKGKELCVKLASFYGTANPLVPFELEDFDYGFTAKKTSRQRVDKYAVESDIIPSEGLAAMDMAVATMKAEPESILRIEAYADTLEKDALAVTLKRAKSACDYCVKEGVELERIAVKSYGAANLVAIEGSSENRRVELAAQAPPDSTVSGFIGTYLAAIQDAIDLKIILSDYIDAIIRNKRTKHPKELYFTLTFFLSEIMRVLEEFITSCYYEKFEVIYYTLLYRITYLQKNDLSILSNFIKKHPGIDHKAGVQPGGTFIVVHEGLSTGEDEIFADFTLPYLSSCGCECQEIPPPGLGPNNCTGHTRPFPVGLTINGAGYFEIPSPNGGKPWYKERVTINPDEKGQLIDENRNLFNLKTIQVPIAYEAVAFAADGSITAYVGGKNVKLEDIRISTFDKPENLELLKEGYWVETAASGAPKPVTPGTGGSGTITATQVGTVVKVEQTNNPMHLFHKGRGLFPVIVTDVKMADNASSGTIAYAGPAVEIGFDGKGMIVNGHRYTPKNVKPIPPEAINITIAPDGKVTYDTSKDTGIDAGFIESAIFPSETGLIESAPGVFLESKASGKVVIGKPGSLGRGELEQGVGPCPTGESELNLPVFAPPQLVLYKLGDYAFGKDVDANYGKENAIGSFIDIDVLPEIQYDRQVFSDPTWIKLSVLTNTGSVQVITDSDTNIQRFRYSVPDGFLGVDCFYYFFEIIDPNGNRLLKTSTCAKVCVHVVEEDTQHIELETSTP